MKRIFLLAAAIAAAIFACTRLAEAPAPTTDPPIKNCFCGDTTNCQQFCSRLPIDVTEKFNPGYDGALTPAFQPPFDELLIEPIALGLSQNFYLTKVMIWPTDGPPPL